MAGLVVAAPASHSGKTVFTLGLLRLLARRGLAPRPAKVGPDYIDPAFLSEAAGTACVNLDAFAHSPETIAALGARLTAGGGIGVLEGVMGLFDGAEGERGSTADLAQILGWPVVLVVDASAQGASAAAAVEGFHRHREGLPLAGVVFNRIGGARHAQLLRDAMARALPEVPVLGAIPRDAALAIPERHLGLVQASEHAALAKFLDAAADAIEKNINTAALLEIAGRAGADLDSPAGAARPPLAPLGQRIAIASDVAFAFTYALTLEGWRAAGAELSFFSPLADEAPAPSADAVYLPGGYPELHAGKLANATRFLEGVRGCARAGRIIFGECGGYMVLGEGLIDADGRRHRMAGLLALETSFAERRLHLGYRRAKALAAGPLGPAGSVFAGHEFHYASINGEGPGDPLFETADASGRALGRMGLRAGVVMGSFVHLIARN
ncbi:MAG: cobyrinate a,c-diamide synthase [Pseudomonadota bacterium]